MGGVTEALLIRGDVWVADFDPTRGREQRGRRPAVIISSNLHNSGPSQLVSVVPLTTRHRQVRSHVAVLPPEGGLAAHSFAMCEQLRVFAVERLLRRQGSISPDTMAQIEDRLRILLDL
ncbi:MAG: type II toxin-antitoxin system PemK/MazF family toxin [Chloroflexota bacterium]|nr:type II toxin-antitoxin system PemK/MazF family toxin [Chloroflexota bacterium]